MKSDDLSGLKFELSSINPKAVNFRLTSWPPPADFPITNDSDGHVISRYGDCRWDLSPLSGRTLSIYFGDGVGKGEKLCLENASLLRQIVAWWLWGQNHMRSINSLVARFDLLKPLFVYCTQFGIVATDMGRHPHLIEQISGHYKTRCERLIAILNELWAVRDLLGFFILDEEGIKLYASYLINKESVQTAYIPPRIWTYQVLRLRECLDDYLKHRKQIEACFRFCLKSYARNAGGSLSDAFGGLEFDNPFTSNRAQGHRKSGKIFYGKFINTAERFGIADLLVRWKGIDNNCRINSLSSYLSLVSNVGLAYILNFSLMRIDEGSRLRADCFTVERDSLAEDVYLLQGVTSKTIVDDDARWIVSPSVKVAIEAMGSVANLRLEAAKYNPVIKLTDNEKNNPSLQSFPHEPWNSRAQNKRRNLSLKQIRPYSEVLQLWPKIFDEDQLKINEVDLEIANRMTYGLDPDRYAVGKVWPLAWHQLRRTGAVNMLASGLVTEASLQYQLKHASRAMSQYYGKNYYRLKEPLSDEARGFYLKEMYKMMMREFMSLQEDRYISPHGTKRKDQVLSEIAAKDHKSLLNAAKSGKISYRETFLGGCVNNGPPCPLGGISNISGCMGFKEKSPCKSVLLNRDKLPLIRKLRDEFLHQVKNAEPDSPLHESLSAQIESAERAINVIESNQTSTNESG